MRDFKSKKQQYNEYLTNGGTMTVEQWENDGRWDKGESGYEFDMQFESHRLMIASIVLPHFIPHSVDPRTPCRKALEYAEELLRQAKEREQPDGI